MGTPGTRQGNLRQRPNQPCSYRDLFAGVTQVTLAAASGVTQAYVSDVARQRYSRITLASARKFTRFFGCPIDDLFPSS